MSLHETWRTIKYWKEIGDTLMLEYSAIKATDTNGLRILYGVIVLGNEKKIAKAKDVDVTNKDIIVIQTKKNRLGMYLMGQAFFSREIMKRHNPHSIRTVAICGKGDSEMEAICREFNIEVEVFPDNAKNDI